MHMHDKQQGASEKTWDFFPCQQNMYPVRTHYYIILCTTYKVYMIKVSFSQHQ